MAAKNYRQLIGNLRNHNYDNYVKPGIPWRQNHKQERKA